jgi:hypothetical protein
MQVSDAPTSEPGYLASETSQELKDLIVWVRRNIEAAHETSKKYYDKHHRNVHYRSNQKVLLCTHTLSSKDMKVSAGIWTIYSRKASHAGDLRDTGVSQREILKKSSCQ